MAEIDIKTPEDLNRVFTEMMNLLLDIHVRVQHIERSTNPFITTTAPSPWPPTNPWPSSIPSWGGGSSISGPLSPGSTTYGPTGGLSNIPNNTELADKWIQEYLDSIAKTAKENENKSDK